MVVQDVRGRGESTGVFDCITDYEDGMATLSWITSQVRRSTRTGSPFPHPCQMLTHAVRLCVMHQPWYSPDHGVGLLGLSYNGFVLWSTFREGPVHPAVRAVVPINTTSRSGRHGRRSGHTRVRQALTPPLLTLVAPPQAVDDQLP